MKFLETITCTLSSVKEAVLDTLSDIKEYFCDFFDEETTVTRKTIAIICIISALVGIIYGFLISPIKKGIHVNVTNNGNYCGNDDKDDWE